jgi:hypothetical protein
VINKLELTALVIEQESFGLYPAPIRLIRILWEFK